MTLKKINFAKRPSILLDPGKMLQKAKSLTVKRLAQNLFYVRSAHPDPKVGLYGYLLVIEDNEKIRCQCKSFIASGICSHVVAVGIFIEEQNHQ